MKYLVLLIFVIGCSSFDIEQDSKVFSYKSSFFQFLGEMNKKDKVEYTSFYSNTTSFDTSFYQIPKQYESFFKTYALVPYKEGIKETLLWSKYYNCTIVDNKTSDSLQIVNSRILTKKRNVKKGITIPEYQTFQSSFIMKENILAEMSLPLFSIDSTYVICSYAVNAVGEDDFNTVSIPGIYHYNEKLDGWSLVGEYGLKNLPNFD